MHKTEQYYELDKEIVDFFREVETEFAFAMSIKYIFQANCKQKSLINLMKKSELFYLSKK